LSAFGGHGQTKKLSASLMKYFNSDQQLFALTLAAIIIAVILYRFFA
jgi:hypothetical protein